MEKRIRRLSRERERRKRKRHRTTRAGDRENTCSLVQFACGGPDATDSPRPRRTWRPGGASSPVITGPPGRPRPDFPKQPTGKCAEAVWRRRMRQSATAEPRAVSNAALGPFHYTVLFRTAPQPHPCTLLLSRREAGWPKLTFASYPSPDTFPCRFVACSTCLIGVRAPIRALKIFSCPRADPEHPFSPFSQAHTLLGRSLLLNVYRPPLGCGEEEPQQHHEMRNKHTAPTIPEHSISAEGRQSTDWLG